MTGERLDEPFQAERLDGRVLVVTGATHGLGAAIAVRAARLRAAGIVTSGRNAVRGEAVRRELESLGCDAVFVAAELEDEAACRAVIAACDERVMRAVCLRKSAHLAFDFGFPHDIRRS